MRLLIVTIKTIHLLFFLTVTIGHFHFGLEINKAFASENKIKKSKNNSSLHKVGDKKNKSSSSASSTDSQLSTNINFNDLTVRGLRQSPLGVTTTVENEKNIPRLIDYRSNFQDRAVRSASGR